MYDVERGPASASPCLQRASPAVCCRTRDARLPPRSPRAPSPRMTELGDRLRSALAATYTIGRELGRGGMATVYLARDLKHGRDVALKVLNDDVAASVGRERFLREIQLAAKLSHPHILPL